MTSPDPKSSDDAGTTSRQKIAMIVGVAVLAGVGVWLATAGNREGVGPLLETASGEPRLVDQSEMASISDRIGHTIFWAGDRSDAEIEVRHDDVGNIHLRYLTDGAEPGDPRQEFLDIGTYPFAGAFKATTRLATKKNLTRVKAGDGVGFYDPSRPTSVFLVYPDQPDYQIEVYYPDEAKALDVALSGDIVPMP